MPAKDLPVHPEQLARIVSREGIAVREDTLYTNHKGAEKNSLRKRADKALTQLQEILGKVLEPDEAVFWIAPAQEPLSIATQLTLGWYSYSVSKCMLVLTNRQLLVFGIDPKSFGGWKWAHRLRSIRWGDIAEAKARSGLISGTLALRYQNGKKEKFWGLRGGDARKLRKLVEALLPGSVGEGTAEQAPVALCPNCVIALSAGQEKCPQCSQEFATYRELIRRSLLIPGGGYFYVGLSLLGVLDAFVESMLIAFLAVYLLTAAGFPEPFLGPLDPYTEPPVALIVAGFFGVLLILEKLVTIRHGKHFVDRFHPSDKRLGTRGEMAWGIVNYALIALFVWAVIPEKETPLVEIAPDVTVYRADFGTFQEVRDGVTFTPTNVVPRRTGQRYGFILRLRPPCPQVKLRVEFEFGEPPAEGEVNVVAVGPEDDADCRGGVVAWSLQVAADEPEEKQTLKVYLDGKLVKAFPFSVR